MHRPERAKAVIQAPTTNSSLLPSQYVPSLGWVGDLKFENWQRLQGELLQNPMMNGGEERICVYLMEDGNKPNSLCAHVECESYLRNMY